MNNTEFNEYMNTVSANEMATRFENGILSIDLEPLPLSTIIAIANKISSEVVTDFGEYRPELREPFIYFYILKESAGIDFTEFDAEEMFEFANSGLGLKIDRYSQSLYWLVKLNKLIEEKIEHRKSIYCNPANLVNDKLSSLIDKELSVQNALYESVKYMEDLSQNFTADDMSNFLAQIQEFTTMMKAPKVSDRFFETVQKNAQDERIQEAEKIVKLNAARNVLADVTDKK